MRLRTALLLAAIVTSLGGAGVYGFVTLSDGGTLEERWVSDTARTYQANHHSVAATRVGTETVVVAPLNELRSTEDLSDSSCALVRLDAATGETVWTEGLAAADCTNHALPDPALADVEGDGSLEALVARGDRTLTVHDAASGDVGWRHPTSSLGYGQPAVADVLPSEGNETVVVDIGGSLFVVRADGTTAWRRNLSTTWAAPRIADFDGDGDREIAVGTGDAVHLFAPDGDRLWRVNRSARRMAVGQADGDPAPELFVAGLREVAAIDGDSQSVRWTRPFGGTASIHGLGEDDDGTSVVYVAESGGTLSALDGATGHVSWSSQFPGENRVMAAPSVGDLDGDGVEEVVAVTMDGVVRVLDAASGEQRATYERDVPIWTHPTIADLDGDGEGEVLAIYGDGRVVALSYER